MNWKHKNENMINYIKTQFFLKILSLEFEVKAVEQNSLAE